VAKPRKPAARPRKPEDRGRTRDDADSAAVGAQEEPRETAGAREGSVRRESATPKLVGPPTLQHHAAGLLLARPAWGGRAFWDEARPGIEPEEQEIAATSAAVIAPVPVQAPTIDRSIPPDVFYLDTPVRADGQTLAILRRPYGFPSGPLPGDPGPFSSDIDPRARVCHVLSAAAAARCSRRRGYF
jgi:hypothetical protein